MFDFMIGPSVKAASIPAHLNGHGLTIMQKRVVAFMERKPTEIGLSGQLVRLVRVKESASCQAGQVLIHTREGRYLEQFRVALNGAVITVPYSLQPKSHTWVVLHRYDEPKKTPDVDLSDVPKVDPDAVADYEERQETRKERYEELADKNTARAGQRFETARTMAKAIPFGQPILVGHHSEKSDRAYRKRIDTNMRKGVEHSDKAKHFERKAKSVGANNAIRSDDPAALQKLANKISDLEAAQKCMKSANVIVRSNKTHAEKMQSIIDLGYQESTADDLLIPDFGGRVGFNSYQLQNNNANIRRLKKRFATIKEQQSRPEVSEAVGDATVKENAEYNSVEISFPGKPSEEIRTEMKRHGWRWARTTKVWYKKQRTDAVLAEARRFAEMFVG